jgi:L-lactate dehydrogenase complex protein LldG
MEFSPSVVERFTQAFEKVAGIPHVARSFDDVPGLVEKIVKDRNASYLALANLPEHLVRAITDFYDGEDVRVVSEPYPAASLPGVIDQAHVGITGIAFGIAQTGTLVEIATNDAVRLVSALPRTHIGVLHASHLVENYEDAAPHVRALFTQNPSACTVSFLSGPSRTGDIELKLTLGVHGPESAHAIIVLE